MNNRILIAEDEANLRHLVASYLIKEGFQVCEAANGKEAIELFESCDDLVLAILDIMMPEADGYQVCAKIREHSQLPVLMLTARDGEEDEVRSFCCGADEYITKPFSPAVLVLRVKNLLKRTSHGGHGDIHLDHISLLYHQRQVLVDGQPVLLTPREFDLLYYLLTNRGIVLTRENILETVWGMDYTGDERTVDTHIKCLRAKLGSQGGKIITLRKVGYKFDPNR